MSPAILQGIDTSDKRSRSIRVRYSSAHAVANQSTVSGGLPWDRMWQNQLEEEERPVWASLRTPAVIQAFLDGIPYSTDNFYRCPLRVLRDRRAHCFDGALFGAAALRSLGHPPLLLDMLSERDDEHMLALYKADGHWGAVAKSNFSGLRFREPVYRTLRELVMSYFEDFFNSDGEKTLRGYTVPVRLVLFDRLNWMTSDEHLERIAERTDQVRRFPVLTPQMIARLSPMDERSYRAGMLGTDPAGLYQPPNPG